MNNSVLKRVGIVIAALIPVAIVGAFVFKGNDEASAPSSTTPTTSGTSTTPSTAGSTTTPATSGSTDTATTTDDESTYKDGTYTATGTYTSPEGPQSVGVTLTIKDDVVTDASLTENAKAGTPSSMWQAKFAAGYEAVVVGKNLEDLKLTKVSGSSLTPIGFNEAVANIRTQADAS